MPEHMLSDADESPLAAYIREFMGVGPNEPVVAVTPQFTRTDGKNPYWHPKNALGLDALKTAPAAILLDLGLREWDKGHWLYPGEWYNHIPAGYEVLDINGKIKRFDPDVTDNDIRFGCLAYGFREENPNPR